MQGSNIPPSTYLLTPSWRQKGRVWPNLLHSAHTPIKHLGIQCFELSRLLHFEHASRVDVYDSFLLLPMSIYTLCDFPTHWPIDLSAEVSVDDTGGMIVPFKLVLMGRLFEDIEDWVT